MQGWSFCWQKGIFARTVAKTGNKQQKLVKAGKNSKNQNLHKYSDTGYMKKNHNNK